MQGDGPHEERGHAVACLADPLGKFSGKDESIGERTEPLELRKGEPAALSPVHRAAHPQVAVHAPYGVGGLPGVEPDRVKPVPRDVLLRPADLDPVPEAIGLVLPPSLEERRQLIRRRGASGERFPRRDGNSLCGRVEGSQIKSSRIPMKIILSRDWGTPKYIAFISLAETR